MANEEKTLYGILFPTSILLGYVAGHFYGPEIIEYINNLEEISCQGLVNFTNNVKGARFILGAVGAVGLGTIIHHSAGYLDTQRDKRRRQAHNQELKSQHNWLYNMTHKKH